MFFYNAYTTKFLFHSCNDEKNKINMSDINTLLNDLNSLNYLQGKFVDKKTAARLIESFININTQEETLIVKSCCLLTVLMNKQKIQLIEWQLKCLNFNFAATACAILMSMLLCLGITRVSEKSSGMFFFHQMGFF